MKIRRNAWLVYLIGGLVGAIALVIGYIIYLLLVAPPPTDSIVIRPDDVYNGITTIEPPIPMPDFTLIDQHNETIHLTDLSNKPTLITFGFTHCPDICPLTLGEMRRIHAEIGDIVNYVFISVDGERDTPAILRDYFELLRVDSFLIGMTGTPDDVRAMSTAYWVEFIHNPADENGNYDVDHTAGMFLLDARRNWIRRYSYGTVATLIATDIQSLVDGGNK